MTSATSAAVGCVVKRLEISFEALSREVADRKAELQRGGDSAAVNFLTLLQRVIGKLREGFEQFRAQQEAPPEDQLPWHQYVGANLSAIVGYLGAVDGALAPHRTPLVAAFERLLWKLLPSRQAIFVQQRLCSYELQQYNANEFDGILGEETREFDWPALIVVFPAGLLDSPLTHVLVGHELGHAIAAVTVASKSEFNHDDLTFDVPADRIYQLTVLAWNENGHAPVEPDEVGQLSFAQQSFQRFYGVIFRTVKTVYASWYEELFSDAVGVCLLGPAYLFAFIEYFVPLEQLERATEDHPALGTRILFLREVMKHVSLHEPLRTIPLGLAQRFEGVCALAERMLATINTSDSRTDREIFALVAERLKNDYASIIDRAVTASGSELYTGNEFRSDIESYLEDLVRLGIPPIGQIGERRVSLATILNVGQIAALDRIEDFALGCDPSDKERRLDELLLKAIELAEAQVVWEEA